MYIPGDIDEIISTLHDRDISCDAIGSYDVIEHIYNIEEFLSKLKDISDDSISIFMGSGANSLNPLIRKKLMKQHRFFEYSNRQYKYGRKPTDETRALFDVRKEIIIDAAPELNPAEVDILSKRTRGLLLSAIQLAAVTYRDMKILPSPPIHPTNTCDPYTGNWFEHLMDPFYLSSILKRNSFDSKVESGYYSSSGKFFKRKVLVPLFNLFIRISGRFGLNISPFYVIQGIKT